MSYLLLKTEFEKILTNYQASEAGRRTLAAVKFVGLTGITSSGKDTISQELIKSGDYHLVVSDTTRPPRENNGKLEQNGVEYWFRSEEEMLADLQKGLFLEAEIIHQQQVSGVSIRELERAADSGKIAITDIDPQGVIHVLKAKPDTVIILVMPPDFSTWLKRLESRGTMEPEEIKRRAATFTKVFGLLERYPQKIHCVINNNLDEAVAQVDAIAKRQQSALVDANPAIKTTVRELMTNARQFLG